MLQFPTNYDIAELFFELAELTNLASRGKGGFKAKAYEKGAWTMLDLSERATDLSPKELQDIDGVGKSIASKITEYGNTGEISALSELRSQVPIETVHLARLSGIGNNKLELLKSKLGVESISELAHSIESGELKSVAEFGAKAEIKLERQVAQTAPQGSVPISMAIAEAKIFIAKHGLSTFGLISGSQTAQVQDFSSKIQIFVPSESYTALSHTGISGDSNCLCVCSQRYGLPIEIYDRAEVQAPTIQLLGDLHFHTDASGDGKSSLEEMVKAAKQKGITYIAVTDHAEDLRINGLSKKEMQVNRARINELNDQDQDVELLFGAELNIGADGSLDYDSKFRSEFDYTVASIHSHFELDKEQQTKRLVKAISDPTVDSIGHLSGRKIGRRAGIEFDHEIVIEALHKFNVALEINSSLDRLDATREITLMAAERGVPLVINSDSHHTSDLERLYFGALLAEDMQLDASDILNAKTYLEFDVWLKSRH